MGRIETVYKTLDEIAQAILWNKNRIPMTEPKIDPNTNKPCSWPETYLIWKEKVLDAEKTLKTGHPLSKLQWKMIELYLENQYGLKL